MFRLDRSRRAGPLLEWKVTVFVVAAVLGLSGIYLEESWFTGAAILLLLGALLLRFLPRAAAPSDRDQEEDE